MRTAGIIAEYNPFHNGHLYQITYTKEKLKADYVIIAMSGDYVQRGTPALLPKHIRAEMALRCGADLVLELPVSVSTASAEFFAQGSVSLLDGLGVVDMLCFGSEAGEVSALNELAEVLVKEPEEYKTMLKTLLSQGQSFPSARSQALLEYFKNPRNFLGDDFDGILIPLLNEITEILASPNNILGIEYCKALQRLNSRIKPVTVKRAGSGYHETEISEKEHASATAIRKLFLKKAGDSGNGNKNLAEFSLAGTDMTENNLTSADLLSVRKQVPDLVFPVLIDALTNNAFVTEEDFNSILHYCLLMKDQSELCRFLDISDNLAQRIVNQRNCYRGFSCFSSLLKTKEITQTRIQRALLHLVLGITQAPRSVPYARVLGFRKDSTPLLKEIKEKSSIPLLTKPADAGKILPEEDMKLFDESTFASNLYEGILSRKSNRSFVHEYTKPVVIF